MTFETIKFEWGVWVRPSGGSSMTFDSAAVSQQVRSLLDIAFSPFCTQAFIPPSFCSCPGKPHGRECFHSATRRVDGPVLSHCPSRLTQPPRLRTTCSAPGLEAGGAATSPPRAPTWQDRRGIAPSGRPFQAFSIVAILGILSVGTTK